MKKLTSLILSLSLMTTFGSSVGAVSSNIAVTFNGQLQSFQQSPIIVHDLTLVPLRDIFEMLEAEIKWDDATHRVTAVKDNNTIILDIGKKTAFINSKPVELDIEARIVNGRTMVPLRFVSEALGAQVKWDSASRSINITNVDSQQGSLKLDEAIKFAITTNRDLKQLEADQDRNKEVRDNLSDQITFTPTGTGNGESDAYARQLIKGLSQTDLNSELVKKQYELKKESIAYSVKKAYDDIILQTKSLAMAKLTLEQADWQKRLVTVKLENGMSSQTDLTLAENSFQEAKAQYELATKAVEDAYQKLNHLMGKNSKDRYDLTEDTQLTKIGSVDLETHINQVTSSSIAVWLAEQKVKLAELDVDLYTFNSPGSDPYQVKKIDVKKAQLSAADTKEQMKQSIRNIYYSVKQMEEQYDVLNANLNNAVEGLKLIQKKYELGMATALEVLNAKLQVENLNKQILDITLKIDQLKIAFEKPWVLAQ